MYYDHKIWIGDANGEKVCIVPKMANRHGLIAGATGTGKTVTLKVLAESFSNAGVPVFLADVKGDLAGMCRPGEDNTNMQQRIADFKLNECGFQYQSYPTTFWDIFGQAGIPLRTTISEMGPLLLSKLMVLVIATRQGAIILLYGGERGIMVVLLLLRIALTMDACIGVVVPCCAGNELFLIECHYHLIAILIFFGVVPLENQIATAVRVCPRSAGSSLNACTTFEGEAVGTRWNFRCDWLVRLLRSNTLTVAGRKESRCSNCRC